MIINRIDRAFGYFCLGEKIETALRFLQNSDLQKLPPKRYEIDGTSIFGILQEYQTKPKENGFWEGHQKYIDIQMVISGCEMMGYSDVSDLQMLEYDETKDLATFSGLSSTPSESETGSFIKIPAGSFIIFYPYDAHMPGIMIGSPEPVKKIVIKVSVE